MNISIITSTPQSVSLGSGTYVAEDTLKRGLEELGHSVSLVCPNRDPGSLGHTWQRFTFNMGLSPRTVADSDVVLGLDMDGFTLSGHVRPFVSYIMGILADEARFERGRVAQLLKLQARAERRCARQADLVVSTSEYSAQRIAQLYGIDRVSVVPPAFDVKRWQSDLERSNRKTNDTGLPTLLCVAHMYPRKDIRTLLHATRLLVDRNRQLRVRIVGDGPERRALLRIAHRLELSQVIHFTGQLPHADLVAEFSSCDVFCLPSLQEGFGIVFLEAMASGKPIVAARASSTPELVEHRVNGVLANPGDANDLAEKIGRCLDDPDLRARMATANRAKAGEFDLERTIPRLLDLMEEARTM